MFENKKNWANIITFSRILGVGLIFYLTPYTTNVMALVTILIYTVVCLTDFLDGYIARKYNAVSDLGKIMDPLADKILVLVLLPLLFMHAIDAFPVFLILAREFAIMGIRVFSAKQGIIIAANYWGKIKTAVTLPVCGILMARIPVSTDAVPTVFLPIEWLRVWVFNWPEMLIQILIWIMVSVTLLSLIDYGVKCVWQHFLAKSNGDIKGARKMGFVLIPNAITLVNLLCGVMAVVTALKMQFDWSVFYMMTGAILDAFDGKIARKLGVYSQFGAHLDTKADVVTFGVAPAVLIAQFLNQSAGEYGWLLGGFTGVLFYGCVHYRLKRYQHAGHHDIFSGVPSPVGATVLGMVVISVMKDFPLLVMGIAIALSLLMVSTIGYPHNRLTPHIVVFNVLSKFSILFWFILLFQLIGVPFPDTFYIIEITLGLSISYLITPILMRFSTIPQSNSDANSKSN